MFNRENKIKYVNGWKFQKVLGDGEENQSQHQTFFLPSYDKLLDFRLPNKQNENDEALKAVEKITEVENVSVFESPRD